MHSLTTSRRNKTTKTKIYALQDEVGKIRYVGKTCIGIRSRFLRHLKDVRRGYKNHRCNWIRSLLAKGLVPTILEIGEVDGDGCREEIAWIKYFREEGLNLVNATDGGEGVPGYKHTKEALRKMSVALTGRRPRLGHSPSAETRKKLSDAFIGRIFSAETKKRMSEANLRPERMLLNRALGSVVFLGKRHSESAKQKNRIAHIGKSPSLQTREKLRETSRMAWERLNPEEHRQRAAMLIGNKHLLGHKHTAETKLKMSNAHKHKKPGTPIKEG